MRPSDAGHQRHRQHDDVLFTKAEKITRARQCAFEKTRIANEMAFTGLRQLEPIVFDDDLDRQPCGSFGKGGSDLRVPGDVFSTQLSVIDLADYGASIANFFSGRLPLCIE